MIRIDHVTFSYGEENENAGGVHDINLTVEDGQCVVLCGESGSGKTTITRLINGLIPHYYEGKMNGEVWVNGAKVSEQPLYDTAKTVGSVFQNPRSQFFNVDTTSEITFGCENLGQPEQSIRERLDKTIRDFRLEKLMGRNIFHLSGGEKQKIACAGVSIMEPDVLVMDEPSSNLDASSILDLRAILAFWKSQGKTIIVSEHRLYYLRGLADRFIYITGGKVEKDYSAAEFESLTEQQRAKLGLRTFILEDLLPPKALPQAGQQMELRNFCFAYKNEPETLHIRESKIPANRIVGIIGNNGAGKSTFSRCFCGLEKRCGEVIWNGRTYRPKDRLNTCYMVMQEVNHQLFTETVLDEVLISMEEENQEWAEEILAELDLIGFKDRHPMSLSGGQKQRVAIASAIASKRSILFFDEPTSGLDYKHMKEVANVLKQVRDAGITLYVITHDLELLLDCCTDIVHFEDGSIIDKFQMDEAGLEKNPKLFYKGGAYKMKEEKKESPIGVLWGWGKPYHGKFIGSIILAVLGVACQMVPYFCVAHIVTLMLSGEQEFFQLYDGLYRCIVRLFGKGCFRQSFNSHFPHGDLLHAARSAREYHRKAGPRPDGDDFRYSVRPVQNNDC